jgi:hypothetical protein
MLGGNGIRRQSDDDGPADPNDQLAMEMRQARGEGESEADVEMSG